LTSILIDIYLQGDKGIHLS